MLSSCKRGARGPEQSNWSSCCYFSVSAPVSQGYYYSSAYSFLFPLPESRGCVSFLPDTLPHSKRNTSMGKIFTKHLQTLPIALEEHECNSNLKHCLPFLNFSSSWYQTILPTSSHCFSHVPLLLLEILTPESLFLPYHLYYHYY